MTIHNHQNASISGSISQKSRRKLVDFALALPEEACTELGRRARARRLQLNLPVEELALRVGISDKTLSNFERTGRCTLETFVRILESLNALSDLAPVLMSQSRSIEDMRQKAVARKRQRAYTRKPVRSLPPGELP